VFERADGLVHERYPVSQNSVRFTQCHRMSKSHSRDHAAGFPGAGRHDYKRLRSPILANGWPTRQEQQHRRALLPAACNSAHRGGVRRRIEDRKALVVIGDRRRENPQR